MLKWMGIHVILRQPLLLSSFSFSFSKTFSFLLSESFLSDHTKILSVSVPSIFLSLRLYFLPLILPWVLVNSDWYTCHSLFDFFLSVFLALLTPSSPPLWTHCRKWSSHFKYQIMLLFTRYPLGLACMRESTDTLKT